MSDPMREIERAAKTQRAKREAKRPSPPNPRDERKRRREMIEKSVAGADSDLRQYLNIGLICALALGLLWLESSTPAIRGPVDRSHLLLAGMIVADIVLLVVVALAAMALLTRLKLGQVYRIGYGLDVGRYLELLSQKRGHGVLHVQLRCANRWTPHEQRMIRDAVATWLPDVEAKWHDDQLLELTCKKVSCIAETQGSDDGVISPSKFFTNRPVHDAFMHVVHRVVPKINAANPIVQLTVAIDGEVYPYDTDPNDKHRYF